MRASLFHPIKQMTLQRMYHMNALPFDASTMRRSVQFAALMALALATLSPAAVQAQTTASTNPMINLVNLLVKQKVISKSAGEALIAQAEAEAAKASTDAAKATELAAAPPQPPESAEGTVRVPYIPEVVRKQLKEELRQEVLQEAMDGGWATPGRVPDWLARLQITGELRVRSQSEFYSDNNTDEYIDFGAINSTGPTDINANPLVLPFLNTRENRLNRLRIRARLGVKADISKEVQLAVRLATGDDNSPISTNQLLGGGLAKKNIWLDQAYVKLSPVKWGSLTFGRMPNPFSTTDLLFDEDLNFDGVSGSLSYDKFFAERLGLSLTGGAFPLDFSTDSYPTNQRIKAESENKWLFAAQAQARMSINPDWQANIKAGYFSFSGVQGEISEPCALYTGVRQCSSDLTRPFFLRKGNSLILLRNILPNPANPAATPQPQFVGLLHDYDVLNVSAQVTAKMADTLQATLSGDYIRNLSFDRNLVCARGNAGLPVNNITEAANGNNNPCTPVAGSAALASYQSGNTGWMVKAGIGYPKPKAFAEWYVEAGYRSQGADATLDSLTDSDFHLGGTNAKGYFIGATFGLMKNVTLGGKWLTANEATGTPLSIDVFQLDLKADF
jgi:Putative porin